MIACSEGALSGWTGPPLFQANLFQSAFPESKQLAKALPSTLQAHRCGALSDAIDGRHHGGTSVRQARPTPTAKWFQGKHNCVYPIAGLIRDGRHCVPMPSRRASCAKFPICQGDQRLLLTKGEGGGAPLGKAEVNSKRRKVPRTLLRARARAKVTKAEPLRQ